MSNGQGSGASPSQKLTMDEVKKGRHFRQRKLLGTVAGEGAQKADHALLGEIFRGKVTDK